GVIVLSVVALAALGAYDNRRLARERDEAREQRRKAEANLALAVRTSDVMEDLGMALYEQNKSDTSEEIFRQAVQALSQAVTLPEAMLAEVPDSPDVRSSLARSYQNLGDLYAAGGKLEEAEGALARARAERRRLVEEHPGEWRFLAQLAITQVVDARVAYFLH